MPRHRGLLVLLVFGITSLTGVAYAAPRAAGRTTIAVAPFTSGSSDEYQWIGLALARALVARVAHQPELNAVTLRQLNAAVRQDSLAAEDLGKEAVAVKLGRLLGAGLLVTGSFEARWPDIRVQMKVLEPASGKVKNTYMLDGGLDELAQLEARLARYLALELGAKDPVITAGAFGTQSLRAWRDTTLALATLEWQSLGPQAADPRAELSLPQEAIQKARTQLEEAIHYDSDYGEAWAALGIAQALLGDTKAAWKSFGKATALGAGHNPTAVVGAAFVRMREGRFLDAADILHAAINHRPGFLLARGYLGELYNHIGRHKDALQAFQEYAEAAPQQPWVLAERGYTKSKLGDYKGAIEDTVAAVDSAPDSPSLLIQLASRYIDAGKLIGAEDALLQTVKLHPDETRAYVRLGYVYLLQKKDDLAIPISEKALVQAKLKSADRDTAYAHLNLARAYGRKGDLTRAFEHLGAAKAAGLRSLAEIENDPELALMRKDPRYRKLAN